MQIKIPTFALITLIGTSSSGKTTFTKKHFQPSQILSADFCKQLVTDHPNDNNAEIAASEVLHFIIKKRLEFGHWTVIDDNNLNKDDRKQLIKTARENHVSPIAIVFNMPEKWCIENQSIAKDRAISTKQISQEKNRLRELLPNLRKEGFKKIYYLNSPEELENCQIIQQKMQTNKSHISAKFDIIGDVHGCIEELIELLEKLEYRVERHEDRGLNFGYSVTSNHQRIILFVGDLVDRGPASNEVLRLVMSLVKNNQAFCIVGNHDDKLLRKLDGRNVKIAHGLEETLAQLETEPTEFVDAAHQFLKKLQTHYIFDQGKLLIAHAGLQRFMHNRLSKTVRSYCMYGETTGKVDERGVPTRVNWAKNYRGQPMIVYGHTPVLEIVGFNNTFDIDTGCVFGGKLTALKYPELELVEVLAKKKYSEPSRPLDIHQFNEMQLFKKPPSK